MSIIRTVMLRPLRRLVAHVRAECQRAMRSGKPVGICAFAARGSDRGSLTPRHVGGSSLRLARRMVSPAPDARLHPSVSFTIEPISARDSLYFRETGFRGQRHGVETVAQIQQSLCRDRALAVHTGNSAPFASRREISLNGGLRGGPGSTHIQPINDSFSMR